ncbi:hypothetical protein HKD37_01G000829 [Glycine soja]
MRAGNSDIYGFLKPQSIQRSGQSQFESESYRKTWMQSSKHDVYLRAYLNGPDNYLKGIINIALKGLDDGPQPKSKAPARWIVVKCNRQKGSTECGYYVMHWMSTIILGTFRNNWEVIPEITKPRSLVRPNQSKLRPQIPLVELSPIEIALLGSEFATLRLTPPSCLVRILLRAKRAEAALSGGCAFSPIVELSSIVTFCTS